VKIDGAAEYAGGYDVEIAKKIAEDLGKKLVIVKTEWDGLIPALESGKIDAVIAGMSPTAERKETIDFSDNYYKSELVMVVKKGGKYNG
ncbi:transporter substrate-binding domain-containing protein, partial [Bacillus thuringiensis]|nr:transporter substrate-binding domain-containing protein [Bacillus thuringiensis]